VPAVYPFHMATTTARAGRAPSVSRGEQVALRDPGGLGGRFDLGARLRAAGKLRVQQGAGSFQLGRERRAGAGRSLGLWVTSGSATAGAAPKPLIDLRHSKGWPAGRRSALPRPDRKPQDRRGPRRSANDPEIRAVAQGAVPTHIRPPPAWASACRCAVRRSVAASKMLGANEPT
jgi:hypothetical protein